MSALRDLELGFIVPPSARFPPDLTRLDVFFSQWSGPLSSLRSLVLREVTCDKTDDVDRLSALSLCLALESLKLVGHGDAREFPSECVPAQLTSLELVRFWPSTPLKTRTVWIEDESFRRMRVEHQAEMRANVKNLYVVTSNSRGGEVSRGIK